MNRITQNCMKYNPTLGTVCFCWGNIRTRSKARAASYSWSPLIVLRDSCWVSNCKPLYIFYCFANSLHLCVSSNWKGTVLYISNIFWETWPHLCHATTQTNTLLLSTVCPALLTGAANSLLLVPVVYFAKCQAKRTEVSLSHCTPPLRCKLAKIWSNIKTEILRCPCVAFQRLWILFLNVSMR